MQEYVDLEDLVKSFPIDVCKNRRRYSREHASKCLEVIPTSRLIFGNFDPLRKSNLNSKILSFEIRARNTLTLIRPYQLAHSSSTWLVHQQLHLGCCNLVRYWFFDSSLRSSERAHITIRIMDHEKVAACSLSQAPRAVRIKNPTPLVRVYRHWYY